MHRSFNKIRVLSFLLLFSQLLIYFRLLFQFANNIILPQLQTKNNLANAPVIRSNGAMGSVRQLPGCANVLTFRNWIALSRTIRPDLGGSGMARDSVDA